MATFQDRYKKRGLLDAIIGIEEDDPQVDLNNASDIESVQQALRPTNQQKRASFWDGLADIGKAMQEGRGLGAGVYDAGSRIQDTYQGVNEDAFKKLQTNLTLKKLMTPDYKAPERSKVTRTINGKPHEGYQQFDSRTNSYVDVPDSFVEVKDPNTITPYQQAMLDAQNRRIDQIGNNGGQDKGWKVETRPDGTMWRVNPSMNVAEPIAGAGQPVKKTAKPLPVALQKLEGEDVDAIQTANTIQADLGAVVSMIDNGSLDLGPVSNAVNQARNYLGASTPQSKNLSSFKAALEKLRNDSLRLNKGVQTDGDAQRAWNELMENINDPGVVRQRLSEIQSINERAAALRAQAINLRRANNGVDPIDDFGQFKAQPAIGGGPKSRFQIEVVQ